MSSRLTVVFVSLLLATPAVICWLWLVIVPARMAKMCPEECECNIGGFYVSCEGPLLTNTVPVIGLTNARVLELVKNNITLIERDGFVSLTELELLRIDASGVRTIELGAFNGLTKLTTLLIVNNEISIILKDTFENLSNLECLDLRLNELQHLDSDVFSGLVNLKYIDLAGNNLQYIHPDTFLGLPNIIRVSLNLNFDLQIRTDRNFINAHSLSELDISHCNVGSLSVETFTNVSALKFLDVRYNDLTTVDINMLRALPKLSTLYLYGNRLQCDCQLQEVWRWCEVRNIATVNWEMVPECDKPSEVEGLWWGVLEKGECVQGNIEYCGDYENTSYSYNDTADSNSYEYGDNLNLSEEYQLPILAFLFIFGTTGNVILLIIIICNKDMRTVPNMYILNLAISDIIYLTVIFSVAFARTIFQTWLTEEFMCTFLSFCRRLLVGLSAYSVAVLSIQRYRVTVNPLEVHVSSLPTWRVIVATICGVWIVAALFAVPSALSKKLCLNYDKTTNIPYYKLVVIFEFLVYSVLPLCVIAFTYIMTARHLVESSRPISDGTQTPQLKTRRFTAKILVGLTVVFLITYVPYYAMFIYAVRKLEVLYYITRYIIPVYPDVYSQYETDKYNNPFQSNWWLYLLPISTWFLLINPCLNPVALFCTSSQFRQHLKRYLTCFCKTNSPPTDIELARRN